MARVDQYQAVVGHAGRHAVDGRLEVLLVSRQVHQRHDAEGRARDLVLGLHLVGPYLVPSGDGLAPLAEPEQVRGGGGRASRLDLVAVLHDGRPRGAAPVVEEGGGEGADEGGLARVHVPHHCDADVARGEGLLHGDGLVVGVSGIVGGLLAVLGGGGGGILPVRCRSRGRGCPLVLLLLFQRQVGQVGRRRGPVHPLAERGTA
mmetsp:Transcript_29346/g.62323  ORF Transcript_29346/g.62323 Transcript_29346/m.62323 type:complete len:204 (-) Transcript_29346:424-1035(-)